MRIDQRREFGQQRVAQGHQVALALHHAAELGEVGLQPVLLGVALRRVTEVVDHRVDVVLELGHFAARLDLDRTRQVALGHRGGHFGDGAHLGGEIRRQHVHVGDQVLPGAGGAGHVRLAAEPAFHTHLARHRGHLVGEDRERGGHGVDGVAERGDLALRFHRQTLAQVAIGDRGHHFHDAADLFRQVVRHHVDVFGEVFPHAARAQHLRLAAQLAFGADFARHARHFGGEHAHLRDHLVDHGRGSQELALERTSIGFEAHALREIALRDRGNRAGHFGRGPQQIVDERVDGRFHRAPRAGASLAGDAHARLAFLAHHLSGALQLVASRWLQLTSSLKVSAILPGESGLVRRADAR